MVVFHAPAQCIIFVTDFWRKWLQHNSAKELSLFVFLHSLFHQMASCQKLKAQVASGKLLFTSGWLLFFDMVTELRGYDAAQAPLSMVT